MRDRIVLHKCGSTAQEDMQRVRDVIGEWRKAASVQWSPGEFRPSNLRKIAQIPMKESDHCASECQIVTYSSVFPP
jgi:hypothetical protein